MKVYCQFKTLSTGYIEKSMPPKFDNAYKKPTDMLGSDGVFILDGRNNLDTMINDCEQRANKMLKKPIGYEIIKADRFTDNGNILYSTIF